MRSTVEWPLLVDCGAARAAPTRPGAPPQQVVGAFGAQSESYCKCTMTQDEEAHTSECPKRSERSLAAAVQIRANRSRILFIFSSLSPALVSRQRRTRTRKANFGRLPPLLSKLGPSGRLFSAGANERAASRASSSGVSY